MKTLIVVDVQNDFVTGSLGTPEAQAIIPNVRKKIAEYRERNDKIIFTQDTHDSNYLETNEGKHLPVPHCIAGTDGWKIVDELSNDEDIIIIKAYLEIFIGQSLYLNGTMELKLLDFVQIFV